MPYIAGFKNFLRDLFASQSFQLLVHTIELFNRLNNYIRYAPLSYLSNS